jgi:hypothetical protein
LSNQVGHPVFEDLSGPVSSGLGFSPVVRKRKHFQKYLLGNARWAGFGPRGHWGRKPLKKYLGMALVGVSGACLFLSGRLFAQIYDQNEPQPRMTLQGMSPQELQLTRQDLRKQKQKLIAENLPMTESEAVKFWAVYQQYSTELQEINDEKFEMIHSYAQNWRSMSNDDALIFMRR